MTTSRRNDPMRNLNLTIVPSRGGQQCFIKHVDGAMVVTKAVSQ